MYVKRHAVVRGRKRYVYLRLAQAYREEQGRGGLWGINKNRCADGVSLYVRPEPGNTAEVSLIGQSLERLRELAGPGGLLIVDSACGHPKTLCQIARAQLHFIAPLRMQSGFRERFLADVGHDALRPLRYVSERERRLEAKLRAKYRGTLRTWEVTDPKTDESHSFRVAYVHSSEEQREVAQARERALTKAEEQLQHIKNGLGGPHYKTRRQVDTRVSRILAGQLEHLIRVKTATRNGRPTI